MSLENMLIAVGAAMCLVLVVQDLRGRWVHLVPVLCFMVTGWVWAGWHDLETLRLNVLANLCFLALVVGLTWLVLKARHPGQTILNHKIGSGDLLFLVAAMGWLDPIGYALFFVSSLILVLCCIGVLLTLGRWRMQNKIPLAGIQAGYLLLFAPTYWHWQPALTSLFMG